MNNGYNLYNVGASAPAPPALYFTGSGSTAQNLQMLPYRPPVNFTQVRPNWPPEVRHPLIPRPIDRFQFALPELPQNLPQISPQELKWMVS